VCHPKLICTRSIRSALIAPICSQWQSGTIEATQVNVPRTTIFFHNMTEWWNDIGCSEEHQRTSPVNSIRSTTTSFSTATTLVYPLGAGITAAAGTRLALQLIVNGLFTSLSFRLHTLKTYTSLFLVTSSLDEHWEICAPAAILRCSSRLSGSFSGIEPWFSVTRHRLASALHLLRYLIGEKLDRVVLRSSLGIRSLLWFTNRVVGLKLTIAKALRESPLWCMISPWITTVIQLREVLGLIIVHIMSHMQIHC